MANNFEEKSFEGLDSDLVLSYCGRRLENIGHRYGPHMRDDYLIYYIKKGEAELTVGNSRILLSGEGFFVNFPHSNYIYRSTDAHPWSIKWISANGELIERYLALVGITREQPFMPLQNGREVEVLFDEMYELFDRPSLSTRIYCISLLHKLFSLLSADKRENKSPYVRQALSIIEKDYASPGCNVLSIANALHLHPNYFSILFKKETGTLPKEAIHNTRMRNAAKMLRFTDHPVKEIASVVGFSDGLYFSRVFRKRFGVSPTEYRRTLSDPT